MNTKPLVAITKAFYAVMFFSIVSLAVSCSPQKEKATVTDPLPSWNDTPLKEAIIDFVDSRTNPESAQYLEEEKRIAVFDNDGTLWSEKPVYFQLYFALDRIAQLAEEHPEWNETEAYRSALNRDWHALGQSGVKGLLQLVAASHAGMDVETFRRMVKTWADTACHPQTGLKFSRMVYQPMLELLKSATKRFSNLDRFRRRSRLYARISPRSLQYS